MPGSTTNHDTRSRSSTPSHSPSHSQSEGSEESENTDVDGKWKMCANKASAILSIS